MTESIPDMKGFLNWLSVFQEPHIEKNGPYTEEVVEMEPGKFCYARVDKNGNPVSLYGERTRQAMIDYAERCRSDFSHAEERESAFDRDYPPHPIFRHSRFDD